MFSCCLFPLILLFSTSSMFELHVVVAGVVMFNIVELIMEIVPNSLTPGCQSKSDGRRGCGDGGGSSSRAGRR
jgi:hypothetical protein